jgi:RND family efflux transporter MFP subunit
MNHSYSRSLRFPPHQISPVSGKIFRVVATLTLLAGLTSCNREGSSAQAGTDGSGSNADVPVVAVVQAMPQNLSKSIDLTAEFKPWQEVEIHAKVAGYVKQINVDVGDHAKTGDVLATLEIPEIQDELKQTEAAVLTAQAQVNAIQAEYNETSLVANRMTAAAKETQGLIAQQDLDTANDKNRANEANLAAAQQKVVEAQANAQHLRDLVTYSTITAPFDGVVTRRYADTGALVQAGTVQSGTGGNSNSMPLVSFAQLNVLRLEFPVPESDVAFVRVGNPVEIIVQSLGKTFTGTVARFAQSVDTATRTMLTEVDVPNSDFAYTPGMYATVRLMLSQKDNALAVPIQSVSAGEKSSVMIVKDNKLENRSVTVGIETPDQAEIISGLKQGDLVVVGNRNALQVGETVRAQPVDNHL